MAESFPEGAELSIQEVGRLRQRYGSEYEDADEADVHAILRLLLPQRSTRNWSWSTSKPDEANPSQAWQLVSSHGKFTDGLLDWAAAEPALQNSLNKQFKELVDKCLGGFSQNTALVVYGSFDSTDSSDEGLSSDVNDDFEDLLPFDRLACPQSRALELAQECLHNLIEDIRRAPESTGIVNGIEVPDFEYSNSEMIQLTLQAFEALFEEVHETMQSVANSISQKKEPGSKGDELPIHQHQDLGQSIPQSSQARILHVYSEQLGYQEQTLQMIHQVTKTIFEWLQISLFRRREAVVRLLTGITALPINIVALANPQISIAVCGPTGVGKTTFMESVLGCRCLASSEDPNSAIPVHVIHDTSAQAPRLILPDALVAEARQVIRSILRAMEFLNSQPQVPLDLPSPSTLPNEARVLYEHLVSSVKSGIAVDVATLLPKQATGEQEVRQAMNTLTGATRLAFHLRNSPRFSRRMIFQPFKQWRRDLKGRHCIAQLPTIRLRCVGLANVPLVGQLSFIDTPGLTEARGHGGGQFVQFATEITHAVCRSSSRVLVLTSPDHHASDAFQRLLRNVSSAVADNQHRSAHPRQADSMGRISIVFNKMDTQSSSLDQRSIEAQMVSYRQTYADAGFPDVHWMRAKLAHDLVWGESAVLRIGFDAMLHDENARNEPGFEDAASLMHTAYGEMWRYQPPLPEQNRVADLRWRIDMLRPLSNVEAVIMSSAIRGVAQTLPSQCLKCVTRFIQDLTDLLDWSTMLLTSVKSTPARLTLIQRLQQTADSIEERVTHLQTRVASGVYTRMTNTCLPAVAQLREQTRLAVIRVVRELKANSHPRHCPHLEFFFSGNVVIGEHGAQIPERIPVHAETFYTFPSTEAATVAHTDLWTQINDEFAKRTIDKYCENSWHEIATALIAEDCNELVAQIDKVHSTDYSGEEEHKGDEQGNISDNEFDSEIAQDLNKIRAGIVEKARSAFESPTLQQVSMPVLTLPDGVVDRWIRWWFIIYWQYSVVQFDACQALAVFTLENRYVPEPFVAEVLSQGQPLLDDAIERISRHLQEQTKALRERAGDIAQAQSAHDIEKLQQLTLTLTDVIEAGQAVKCVLQDAVGQQAASYHRV